MTSSQFLFSAKSEINYSSSCKVTEDALSSMVNEQLALVTVNFDAWGEGCSTILDFKRQPGMGESAVAYACYCGTWEVLRGTEREFEARMNYQKKKSPEASTK